MLFDCWGASPELATCGLTLIHHWTNIEASERNCPNFPQIGVDTTLPALVLVFSSFLLEKTRKIVIY
jgi:hypothetical protein